MGGTVDGARRAVATKIERYGKNVFSKNGKLGGKARNSSKKRFTPFSDSEFASAAGLRGSTKRWGKRG